MEQKEEQIEPIQRISPLRSSSIDSNTD